MFTYRVCAVLATLPTVFMQIYEKLLQEKSAYFFDSWRNCVVKFD